MADTAKPVGNYAKSYRNDGWNDKRHRLLFTRDSRNC